MQLGQWKLDTVVHTDALTLLAGLPDRCVDLAVTSPPYDNLRTYNGYSFDFEPIARESYRVLKPGGVLVWVEGDTTSDGDESLTLMRHAIYFHDEAGFRVNDTMIYFRQSRFPEVYRYWQDFEYMLVLSKERLATFNPIYEKSLSPPHKVSTERQRDGQLKRPATVRSSGEMKALSNVWRIGRGQMTPEESFAIEHPALMPEILAERHILTWSNPGDVVMDFFMGSGTTAKMARNNGRHYLGCDISLEYVELARKRLAQPFTPSMFTAPPVTEPTAEQVALFAASE